MKASTRFVLLAALLPALLPGAATGQTGALRVTISERSGGPLAQARVSVAGHSAAAMADSAGVALLGGLEPGIREIEVTRLGYAPRSFFVEVAAGRTSVARVSLEVDAIELPGLTARVEDRGSTIARATGFLERSQGGKGFFLDRSELARFDGQADLAHAFYTVPMVDVEWGRFSRDFALVSRRSRGLGGIGSCTRPQMWVDGVKLFPGDHSILNYLRPEDVEGIEVYGGLSTVPPRFSSDSQCGAVIIWTR